MGFCCLNVCALLFQRLCALAVPWFVPVFLCSCAGSRHAWVKICWLGSSSLSPRAESRVAVATAAVAAKKRIFYIYYLDLLSAAGCVQKKQKIIPNLQLRGGPPWLVAPQETPKSFFFLRNVDSVQH